MESLRNELRYIIPHVGGSWKEWKSLKDFPLAFKRQDAVKQSVKAFEKEVRD